MSANHSTALRARMRWTRCWLSADRPVADLFLSYAQANQERVEPVAHALEKEGWPVFWNPTTTAGETLHELICLH